MLSRNPTAKEKGKKEKIMSEDDAECSTTLTIYFLWKVYINRLTIYYEHSCFYNTCFNDAKSLVKILPLSHEDTNDNPLTLHG